MIQAIISAICIMVLTVIPSADCMFCLDILDNFGEKKGIKKDGR